jgi:hypothetical protein
MAFRQSVERTLEKITTRHNADTLSLFQVQQRRFIHQRHAAAQRGGGSRVVAVAVTTAAAPHRHQTKTKEKRAKDKVDQVEFSHAVPHMTSLPFFISDEGPVLIHRRVITRLISSLAVSPVWARDTDAQRITHIRHKG